MKSMAYFLAVVVASSAAVSNLNADEPNQQGGKGKRGAAGQNQRPGDGQGKGRAGANRQGRPGQGGPGQGRPGGQGGAGQIDPAKLVERMMSQFDKDGDQKLDANELKELLVSMRSRGRGMGGPGGADAAGQMRRPGARPGAEGRPGGAGGQKRGNRGQQDAGPKGGTVPVRPGSKNTI